MLLDSWAWLEVFAAGPHATKVERVLDEVPTSYTCPTVVAEVYSNIARRVDEATGHRHAARVVEDCAMIQHDEGQAFVAGQLHASLRKVMRNFPLSDAFVLAAARSRSVQVLSGDPHFKGQPDVVFLA